MAEHLLASCRECEELWRIAELFSIAGFSELASDLIGEKCSAEGGLPTKDLIEGYMQQWFDALKRKPLLVGTTPVKPDLEAPIYGHGGPPPFELKDRSYKTITDADVDTALKVIRGTEDAGFMKDAVKCIFTHITERLEKLNVSQGFNKDGSIKVEKPKKEKPIPLNAIAIPPPPEQDNQYTKFSIRHMKRAIKLAKMSQEAENTFLVQHIIRTRTTGEPCAPIMHQFVAQRGGDCSICGGMPKDVTLYPVTKVNRHGKPDKDVKPIHEEWVGRG